MSKRTTAAILAFLLGGIGVHKFYQGKIGIGLIYLLFCWTFIPAIAAMIEFIIYLTITDEQYELRYHSKVTSEQMSRVEKELQELKEEKVKQEMENLRQEVENLKKKNKKK